MKTEIRARLSRYLLLPLGMNLTHIGYRKTRKYCRQLVEHEHDDPAALTAFRNHRFRMLIRHCYDQVPYYQQIMDQNGLTPGDFQSVEDIIRLPFLDKKSLIANQKALLARNTHRGRVRMEYTSGSTGTPTPFGVDLNSYYQVFANAWRFWGYAGYKPGMKMLLFWGNYRDLEQTGSIKKKFKSAIENTFTLNTHNLSPDKMEEYARRIRQQQPDFIRGYGGALHWFVEYCKKNRLPCPHTPAAIITTAENILPSQKARIESYFESELFEEYGSREFGILAHECRTHAGLHLAEDQFIFEVHNPAANRTSFTGSGELLVTSFANYALPLLRYRIGDEGTITSTPCGCGRSLGILKKINGRITDYIVTQSERLLSQYVIEDFFEMVPAIISYQIQQHKKGEVDILVVLDDHHDKGLLDGIATSMHLLFRDDLAVNLHSVDKIELMPSGKRQVTRSSILHHYLPEAAGSGAAGIATGQKAE